MQTASPQRRIAPFDAEAETLEDMTRAIVKMFWDGIDPITAEDLQIRHGFTAREIATHGDTARAEARRRLTAARAEG